MSFQQSTVHHPSNSSADNPKMSNDNPVVTTHHYQISHSATDKVNIHGGATTAATSLQARGPATIGQMAPYGSLYLNTTAEVDAQGMHSLYMNKGDAGWQSVSEKQVYSVKAYGAVGNGLADDTPAIQRALDACQRVQTPYATSKVLFPDGTYRITSALLVNIRGNMVIEGSRDATIKVDNDDCTAFNISKGNVTVSQLIFWNRSVGAYTSGTSIVSTAASVIVRNCRFSGVYNVFESSGGFNTFTECFAGACSGDSLIWIHDGAWDNRIINNQLDYASSSSLHAVKVTGDPRDVVISTNRIWGFIEAISLELCTFVNVTNNVIYNGKIGVIIKGGSGHIIHGNCFNGCNDGGVNIALTTTSNSNRITNNSFIACWTYGIKVDTMTGTGTVLLDTTISNNLVRLQSDTAVAGIHVTVNHKGIFITGNRLVNYRPVGAGIILDTGVNSSDMTTNFIEGWNPTTKTIENDSGVNMLKTNNLIY